MVETIQNGDIYSIFFASEVKIYHFILSGLEDLSLQYSGTMGQNSRMYSRQGEKRLHEKVCSFINFGSLNSGWQCLGVPDIICNYTVLNTYITIYTNHIHRYV